jgi:hypothetical protein
VAGLAPPQAKQEDMIDAGPLTVSHGAEELQREGAR